MSCIIPGSISSSNDLANLKVDPKAVYSRFTPDGKANPRAGQPVPAEVQQAAYVASVVAQNKRPVAKWITATFTATGNATAILGDALGLTSLADANGAWVFQNGGASGGKDAFNRAVNSYPFRYLGIQVDASAVSIFTNAVFQESIADYDNNYLQSFKAKMNAGLNTYAQTVTTRFLSLAGEFNGFWGLYITGLTNGQSMTFSFNCVDIMRGW